MWWQEARRRDLLGEKSNCENCMEALSLEQRQLAGCGFVPPAAKAYPWTGGSLPNKDFSGTPEDPGVTVCPGYSTSLPETIEVARAHRHWLQGGPAAIGVTDWQDEPIISGIEIFAASLGEHEGWSMKPVSKGGGGAG